MRIVIPGGSGQVGTVLARAFQRDGHDVVVLSRQPSATPWRTVQWDAKALGSWTAEIDGADVLVNLAERSVNCRYGQANRREIMDSREVASRFCPQPVVDGGPVAQPRASCSHGPSDEHGYRETHPGAGGSRDHWLEHEESRPLPLHDPSGHGLAVAADCRFA